VNHLHYHGRPSSELSGPCHSTSQEGGTVAPPCYKYENDNSQLEYANLTETCCMIKKP
jgi:hypothetical protein